MQLASFLRRLRLSPFFNSLIVMGGYILSRVTGLVRDVILAAQFGTSPDFAAYRAAFKVPDLLYIVIIGGALGSTFIPVFIEVWDRDGSERAWRMASAVLTWVLGLLALASGLLWVLAPLLIGWFFGGQGFSPTGRELITDLTRLFLLSPLLLGLGGLAMAALNARDRFTLPAMAPSVYNLGIIAGTLVLAPRLGIWGTAWGVIVGALGYLLVQIPGLFRLGMRLRLTMGRGMAELRTIASQMAPRVVGQSAAQLSILVTAALTARLALGDEKLAGLDYAYQLMLLPYGIFALSLSTVAFPLLARLFADRQLDELADRVRQTLRMILFLTLPATVMLMVLAVPLVRLVLQRGEFDQVSLTFTVMPLLAYATALPAFAASEILIRTFYAMQQTLVPVLVGLLQVGLNLGLGILALNMGGNVGTLALAFSVANNIEMLLLLILLQRLLPGIWRDGALRRSVLASGLATVVLGGMVWTVRQMSLATLPFLALDGLYAWRADMLALVAWLVAVGMVALALYVTLAAFLGSGEARIVLSRLRHLAARER
ncbi:MAG: murein biosynthesis integral membrane protein MurJ [Chloroflexales bacterium]|nr:murein biosynthesis integral membrane protein MurJ [Chloroflexales bacterium]